MASGRQTTKYLYIFATALAVAIITLGSLINFHQYKIWGKPLIPQFVGIKRDLDKSEKVFYAGKDIKNSSASNHPVFQDNLLSGVACICYHCGNGIYLYADLSHALPSYMPAGQTALRGPPQA